MTDLELAVEIRRCQFRDLRAKAATERSEDGGILEARDLMGHASVTMTERYVRARAGRRCGRSSEGIVEAYCSTSGLTRSPRARLNRRGDRTSLEKSSASTAWGGRGWAR